MVKNNYLDIVLSKPWIFVILTVVSVVLESLVGVEQFFQEPFFRNGSWLISKEFHIKYKSLLYTGIKMFIIILASAILVTFFYGLISKNGRSKKWVKPSLLVVVCITLVPMVISLLKAITGVYCPKSLIIYGGEQEHLGLLSRMWNCGCTAGGRCFPAGHASGGFALMCLHYLPVQSKWKSRFFYFGLTIGWLMGLYQIARGEHFISHTFTTMFLALTMITLLSKIFRI